MQAFMHRFFRGLKHRPYLSATFALGFVIIFCAASIQLMALGDTATNWLEYCNLAIFVYDSKDDVAFRSRTHLRTSKTTR